MARRAKLFILRPCLNKSFSTCSYLCIQESKFGWTIAVQLRRDWGLRGSPLSLHFGSLKKGPVLPKHGPSNQATCYGLKIVIPVQWYSSVVELLQQAPLWFVLMSLFFLNTCKITLRKSRWLDTQIYPYIKWYLSGSILHCQLMWQHSPLFYETS